MSDSEGDRYDLNLDDDYNLEYSEGSNSDQEDFDLENQYYSSKSLKEDDLNAALLSFQRVLDLEEGQKGIWGFKALKQMLKIYFKLGNFVEMMKKYEQLLTHMKNTVTSNQSEKAINSILEYIGTLKDVDQLKKFYEVTLSSLKGNNVRLWFKTNLKLGHLYYETSNLQNLSNVVKELHDSCKTSTGEDDMKKATQLLEVYALEIQMHAKQRDNMKLRRLYEKCLNIKGGINHPLVLGTIRECGGKMHLWEEQYSKAHEDFFEAFKNYDEAGSPRRIKALKYLVLANMLTKSNINPFDSQEAKPYRNDPEILSLTNLVVAYQNGNAKEFDKILKEEGSSLMDDPFIKERIELLITNSRSQALINLVKPYRRVKLSFLSQELGISESEVETLAVTCIINDLFQGRIDQVNQVLVLHAENKSNKQRYEAMDRLSDRLMNLHNKIMEDFSGLNVEENINERNIMSNNFSQEPLTAEEFRELQRTRNLVFKKLDMRISSHYSKY